jgi:AcrR family transcriptional regulator
MAEAQAPTRLTRRERQEETRRRLIDAAERVFIREGFQGSSVEKIAAEAGFTRGAFYSNYESKEQLFVELLHARVYDQYRAMGERVMEEGDTPRERLRWSAERLGEAQAGEGRWLFRLWLECLTQATRDDGFRKLAATFWSGNRAMLASLIDETFKRVGREPPVPSKDLGTAMIALDIGLAVQHLVDPDEAPLDLYVPLYDLLFGSLVDE